MSYSFIKLYDRVNISRSLWKFAIASRMAKLTAGIICFHIFLLLRVKYHKILANTYLFLFALGNSTDSQLPEERAILSDLNGAKKESKD